MQSIPKPQGLYEPQFEHDACGIGAVVNISGKPEHAIVEYGKQVLLNLMHRGASSADESTGDGAGILLQIPHDFFAGLAPQLGFELPALKQYGVGMLFLPQSKELRVRCERILLEAIEQEGLKTLGIREVPTDNACLGEIARNSEPAMKQIFVGGNGVSEEALERRLYVARKRAERRVLEELGESAEQFYAPSMSCRTICYKGMFLAPQLFAYYPDLADERVRTALAIVHQRYSTNTFPSWRLAQPFRMIAHNGEINTLRGNANALQGYERTMSAPALTPDMSPLLPILQPGGSDSACFDNLMELLVQAGRSAPHALMMMIPEAFGPRYHISTDKRAFYEYHAAILEPWDGPASMVFTDGRLVGGTLDRNGLRPSRFVVTTDGLVILSSEVGVVEFPPEKIQQKGRLQPGRMFLVDTEAGRIITDNEIKGKIARQKPYRRWLEENRIELRGLFQPSKPTSIDEKTLAPRLRAFGYTREDLQMVIAPMAAQGQEPVGSMGTDTPPAVLSDRPKLLFNYFKQLFAQVTNPPIDPFREGLVMSLMTFTGKQRNLFAETPEHCRQLKLAHPILTNEDLERLRSANRPDFKVVTLSMLFKADAPDPAEAIVEALEQMVETAANAIIDEGASLLILSDRGISPGMAAIPSLLAVGALHQGLLKKRLRSETGIVVESGEPREVMHFCMLCGYGAKGINPYLAFEAIEKLHAEGDLPQNVPVDQYADQYITAAKKGILKTMSKMGISTLRSYYGAMQFEAVGVGRAVVDRYFTGTPTRIEGIDLETIAREALLRHRAAFEPLPPGELDLDFGGEYHFRLDGERHLWNPDTVVKLQHAVQQNDSRLYAEYAQAVNDQHRHLLTLRGLFEFQGSEAAPIEEVEPANEIVKRFYTGAMSHGSISKEAHEALAIAMNRLGANANTGEGGEDPARYAPGPNGDSLNCGIKQVASARFGVTIEYLANAKILQIKMAQGAKPGEGGQLPGHKVTAEIAKLRHATPGVSLISPAPHHDIYSIEDLAQLIYDLKCANPGVKVSVKLVSQVGVGTVAAGVAKGNADEVLISGHDGGTGASPLSSIKYAGSPWEIGLAETQQTLILNGLRDRIVVQADGQMKTGRDVVIAALLGAERFGFGTSALVSLGCLLMRKCHLGTCPVGIATQDPKLREKFGGKPDFIVRYLTFVAEEIRQYMAQLGFRKFEDMVGRSDKLCCRKAVEHWKAKGLDFSKIFAAPDQSGGARRCVRPQTDQTKEHLDWKILERVGGNIESAEPVKLALPIRNTHRTVGTIISNRIVRRWGSKGLPDGAIELSFTGSAGQSFGAFLAPGVTLKLTGDANDYLGKGLSGGRIVVVTPPGSPFDPKENVIVGNTLLYGATAGEAFINGLAGERFAVRNSGATAVIEGVGDHGCEYMTGGVVAVIGRTGRNFAAGMSGGVAYVFDELQLFDTLCNLDMVELESIWQEEDQRVLLDLLERHHRWTGSAQARRILDNWPEMSGKFVKVMPIDYRKALEKIREREQVRAEETDATEEVFQR